MQDAERPRCDRRSDDPVAVDEQAAGEHRGRTDEKKVACNRRVGTHRSSIAECTKVTRDTVDEKNETDNIDLLAGSG